MQTISDIIAEHPDATDAQIADLFNAQVPVYRRVPVQDVRDLFTERRLNSRLRLARENPALPIQLRGGIIELFATLDGFEYVNATVEQNRLELQAVTGGLVQAQVVTSDDAGAFLGLLVDASVVAVTEADVTAERARITRANAIAAQITLATTYLNEIANPSLADPGFAFVTLADWLATR